MRCCALASCGKGLVQKYWEKPGIFAARAYCDRTCANKALNRTRATSRSNAQTFSKPTQAQQDLREKWRKRGADLQKAQRQSLIPETSRESPDDFIARGGKITKCPAASVAPFYGEEVVPRGLLRSAPI